MVANTLKFIIMWVFYLFGLIFTLILMYASPDSVVHNFEASIFYLAGAIGVFGILFGLSFKSEPNNLIVSLYIISILLYILYSVTLDLIYIYANPAGNFIDSNSAYITSLATLLYVVSFAIVLLKKGGQNE